MRLKDRVRGRLPLLALGIAAAAVAAGVAQAVIGQGIAPETSVVGDLQLAGYGPAVPIKAFHWGLTNSIAGCGGGGGCGKVSFAEVQLSRPIDANTPPLLTAALSGRHIQTATVRLYAPGSSAPYVYYNLQDVTVSAEATATGPGGLSVERLALTPTKLGEQPGTGPQPLSAPAEVVGTLRVDGIAQPFAVLGHTFGVTTAGGKVASAFTVVTVPGGLAGAQLEGLAAGGSHIRSATLDLVSNGAPYATLSLQDVLVTKLQDDAAGSSLVATTETLTLAFGKLTETAGGASTCVPGELAGVC